MCKINKSKFPLGVPWKSLQSSLDVMEFLNGAPLHIYLADVTLPAANATVPFNYPLLNGKLTSSPKKVGGVSCRGKMEDSSARDELF